MTLRWRRWRRVVAIEGVRDWWAAGDRRQRLGSFAWRRLVLDEHTRCAVFDRFRGLLSTSCDGAHIDFFIRSETGVDGDDPDGRNDATGTSAAGVTRRLISPLFVQCLCSVPPTRADPSPLHAARNLWPRRRPSLPIQTATNRLVVQTVESHACLSPFLLPHLPPGIRPAHQPVEHLTGRTARQLCFHCSRRTRGITRVVSGFFPSASAVC